jgi:hypothetical protein
MAKSPDPTAATPNPLLLLIDTLNDSARAIDDFIADQPDRLSPECLALRAKEQAIISSANDLQAVAMQEISSQIKQSIGVLKAQVDNANATIRRIAQAKKVMVVVASVLSAAAAFAAGGPIAAAPAIPGLVAAIGDAVAAAEDNG